MVIRKCEKKDIEEVIRIENKSFDHPYPDEVFHDYLSSDLFLVAEEREESSEWGITGYVIGKEKGDRGMVISIAVSPSHRFEGIGTRLLETVRKRMNVGHLFVTVRPSNKGAIQFYKKLGFVMAGKIKDYYQNGEDGMVMERRKR
ncbi:MAG: GNAT family N-acetyltransferase [Candidatus Thermoplasmatota archaeon]